MRLAFFGKDENGTLQGKYWRFLSIDFTIFLGLFDSIWVIIFDIRSFVYESQVSVLDW